MSSKYDRKVKTKAVRLVREHRDEYETEWAAMKAISTRLGMSTETLRKWVRQAEINEGQGRGDDPPASQQLRELRKKNRELEETIVISGPQPPMMLTTRGPGCAEIRCGLVIFGVCDGAGNPGAARRDAVRRPAFVDGD